MVNVSSIVKMDILKQKIVNIANLVLKNVKLAMDITMINVILAKKIITCYSMEKHVLYIVKLVQ